MFEANSCGIISAIHDQSDDINRGVDRKVEVLDFETKANSQGAGDQGMMFGYATNETDNYMPLALDLAHKLLLELAVLRRENKEMTYLRPDAKSQVTLEYNDNNVPIRITDIVISTQHDDFDADEKAIEFVKERFKDNVKINFSAHQKYFTEAVNFLKENNIKLNGVILDLGVSSRQLDSSQIGLSYRSEMPLDMRFRRSDDKISAKEFLNETNAEDIADVLRKFGEEPAAWKIAQAIHNKSKTKKIETTLDLKNIIEDEIPQVFVVKTLTRVFQALRIFVNNEMDELEKALSGYTDILIEGGRIVVLTYHSIEDRIVKYSFRDEMKDCICPPFVPKCICDKEQRLKIITRKPIVPGKLELENNKRSRSAKLRVAERVLSTKKMN
jgi:16S rRNA (cytosine1402-N4)-methyltransferase